ncbi:MAG: S8 family serine peptidase [Candidatus Hydrogenedentes bacterium]|nr:S8 family serine peptidase [Candidatus Hydrogenedentota bacterium]
MRDFRCLDRAASFLLAAMVLIPSLVTGAQSPGADGKQPARSQARGELVHYYNGNMRVNFVLSLDTLEITPPSNTTVTPRSVSSVLPGATAQPQMEPGVLRVTLPVHAAQRAGLEETAKFVRAEGYSVRPILYGETAAPTGSSAQIPTGQISVKLADGHSLDEITSMYRVRVVEKLPYSQNTYIVATEDVGLLSSIETANAIYESGLVEFATPLIRRQQSKRLIPNDTLFGNQWHLRNTAQSSAGTGAVAGNDVNVTPAWDDVTGEGVNIAIVDDGLEQTHTDLTAHVNSALGVDFNNNDNDPTPLPGDSHGTSCAGVAGAVGNNGTGVSGAAPDATLIGVRLIGLPATDADEADGLGYLVDPAEPGNRIWISSNSWGPSDDGATVETFGPLAKLALENAVTTGRGGRGIVFCWAGGNGREDNDDSGYDGYASSRYTIAVAASGANGRFSYYSEYGSAILVNTPSSWDNGSITTTTTGNSYTSGFTGTSSATPLAAGVIALMLEKNPFLGWRDVQHVLSETSTQNNPADAGWQTNAAGLHFNHAYGFGRVNAVDAVGAAATWINVPAETTPLTNSESVVVSIPDFNPVGITRSLALSGPPDFVAEHVEVTVNAVHPFRGDLQLKLTAPSGTVSTLARQRNGDGGSGLSNWLFTSVAHMGEDPNGTWTLNVADVAELDVGALTSWSIEVYGYIPSTDQDGDGLLDTVEGNADRDGDGLQNYLDTDSDGDSLGDAAEAAAPEGIDPDGDFIPNYLDIDSDGDGFSDAQETLNGTSPYNPLDTPSVPVVTWPVALGVGIAGAFILRPRRRANSGFQSWV